MGRAVVVMLSVEVPGPLRVTGLLVKLHAAPAGRPVASQRDVRGVHGQRSQYHLISRRFSGRHALIRGTHRERIVGHLRRHRVCASTLLPGPITCTVPPLKWLNPTAVGNRCHHDGDGCRRARLQRGRLQLTLALVDPPRTSRN